MKKIIFVLMATGMVQLTSVTRSMAQCCQVITSNGVSAITGNTVCAVLAYPTTASCDIPLDSDGDGIVDSQDKCPNLKGVAEKNGCPLIPKEMIEAIEDAIKNINFETNSDVITASSFPSLEKVAKVLTIDPNVKVAINGHTDNVGDPTYNLTLSQKRSDAVKKYLVDKGVAADRITATGYGETKPIADNSTDEGKAKNRRVEFDLSY
jgi:outer membrane protein OmpA-like peptidoglycan-associated protein